MATLPTVQETNNQFAMQNPQYSYAAPVSTPQVPGNASAAAQQQASDLAKYFPTLASKAGSISSTPSPIPVGTIGTAPVTLPQTQPVTPTTMSVAPPPGTSAGADGALTATNLGGTDAQTQLAAYIKQLQGKGQATTDLQAQVGLDAKTQDSVNTYNAYQAAKLSSDQRIAALYDQPGITREQAQQQASEIGRKDNANLANLAVVAQAAQGSLSAAQATIKNKLDAQFGSIQDNIDNLEKYITMNKNDLTESQKLQLQQKADQQKTEASAVQSAASDIHETLLKANAPASAYSAVDAITQKYTSGQISASQAQSQMYAAAGKYGATASASYTPGTNPTVDAWVQAVLSGNSQISSVPANLKNQVAVGLNSQPETAYSPLAGSRYTLEASRIASNFINLPQFQLTANGLPYLQRIDAAMKTPGSVSDQDLLDSLTKLNTAGNAISDAQVRLVTDGKSFADTVNSFQNKFKNGGVLSDNQRNQIQSIAKAIYANYQKGYDPVFKQVTAQLTAAGIPKAFWTIPDLNNLSAQATGDTPSSATDFRAQYGY